MTVAVMLSLSLASCISDDSTDGNKAIPQLAIEGSDATYAATASYHKG